MSKKISQLPGASSLSGNELLPLVQAGHDRKAGVGVAQVLEAFGDLPTGGPVGKMIYVPDAAGGSVPAYWDGTGWRTLGGTRAPIRTMGPGIWVVGVGISQGVAHGVGADTGFYFTSDDGFNWKLWSIPSMKGAFLGFSYAGGCFLGYGMTQQLLGSALVATTDNPVGEQIGAVLVPPDWHVDPPLGYNIPNVGSVPSAPTAYDNLLGQFTVPITGAGNVTIQNQLPAPAIPDTSWPHNGIGDDEQIVSGVGRQGPVDVRISTKTITITPFSTDALDMETGQPVNPAGYVGSYLSDLIEARPQGTPDWNRYVSVVGGELPVGNAIANMISGNSANAAGLSLRGLVWGIVRQTAVILQPGAN